MSVNKAILVGHLGSDPELRYTPSGTAVASFRLATNERWTGQDGQPNERTTWHTIVVWGKQAENVKEYLRKGRQVYVEGRINNRTYDDREGNKRFTSEVVAQTVQFLGGRDETLSDTAVPETPSYEPSPTTPPDSGGTNDDDLPF
ncbi:MAG: single-stranded DNA-binding protein [Candidatus Zixiibacteriota bacterium]